MAGTDEEDAVILLLGMNAREGGSGYLARKHPSCMGNDDGAYVITLLAVLERTEILIQFLDGLFTVSGVELSCHCRFPDVFLFHNIVCVEKVSVNVMSKDKAFMRQHKKCIGLLFVQFRLFSYLRNQIKNIRL